MRASLALAWLALVLARGAGAATLDYLHLEANEGMAAGGHAALRIGLAVFHFEHEPSGLIRLEREPAAAFEHRVRALENRTIHVARIAVDDATAAVVRDAFTDRLRADAADAAAERALAGERRLLLALRAARDGASPPQPLLVPAAGLFPPAAGDADAADEFAAAGAGGGLADVRRRAAARGVDVAQRARAVHARLARWAETASRDGAPDGFGARWYDAAALAAGLDVLAAARAPRADALRTDAGLASLALDDDERAAVARVRGALVGRLAALAASDAPGTGTALLVGAARVAALDATVARGRWVVVDDLADDARVVPPHRLAREHDALARLADRAVDDLARARRALLASSQPSDAAVPEVALQEVEAAANRLLELRAGLAGRPMRLPAALAVPSRAGPVAAPSVADARGLDAAIAAAARREADHAAMLQARRGYDVLRRNCVTELFRVVDAALARAAGVDPADAPAARAAVAARLGGYVDVAGGPGVVPFVSRALVEQRLDVVGTATLPSRRLATRERVRHEDGALAALREDTVLTADAYEPNPDDSTFLFFTDDAVVARPLLGAANLVVGAGASVVGIATAPFDRGDRLLEGLRGMLFSVPELAFVSLRKGTYLDDPGAP